MSRSTSSFLLRDKAYHARVYGARLIARAQHPAGNGLHVKVRLALL